MEGFFGLLRFALGTIVVLFVLTFIFMYIASKQLPDNPLRIIAGALTRRVIATTAFAGVGMPLIFIPGPGDGVDFIALVFLGFYWLTFFRDAANAFKAPPTDRLLPPSMPQVR
jgi:hypothetical protein